MEENIKKVNAELCAGCKYRTRESAFLIYCCDYASIKGRCRLDPAGFCSHYEKDEKCDPLEVKRRAKEALERQKGYAGKIEKEDCKRVKCTRCRKWFQSTLKSNGESYITCPECRKAGTRATEDFRKRHGIPEPKRMIRKKCARCGAEIETKDNRTKYCTTCKYAAKAE